MRRLAGRAGWAVVLALLVAAWQAYVRIRGVPQYVLPAPTDVARTLWDQRGPLASAAGVTAREMLAGFAAALAFGVAAAVALHASATLRRAVYPLLVASQSVPVVAIAPILVIYLGFGLAPKLIIIALVCFFPITVGALDGFRSVDPEHVRVMRTLRASRAGIFRRVELPWALPSIFTGMRVAASYAAVAALFAEYAGADSGLGNAMREGTGQYDAPLVGAAVVVLAALALALFGAVTLIERVVLPWARRVDSG
jgi:putative hydroxymethylpyrimidine transport system permease protein